MIDTEEMCGRYTITGQSEKIEKRFHATLAPNFKPNFNAVPSQNLPVVLNSNPKEIVLAKWGLLPHWAKFGMKPQINARAETVESKPMFREAFKSKRCLIITDGFIEWDRSGKVSKPYYIRMKSHEPYAMAGIWDMHEGVPTYAIITTEANGLVGKIHDRMPVILKEGDEKDWLEPSAEDKVLLKPYAASPMEMFEVSRDINTPRNNRPDVLNPV